MRRRRASRRGRAPRCYGDAAWATPSCRHPGVDGVGFVGSADTAEAIVRSRRAEAHPHRGVGQRPADHLRRRRPRRRRRRRRVRRLVRSAASAAWPPSACSCSGRCTTRWWSGSWRTPPRSRLGDPLDEGTTIGPLNNEAVAAKVDAHLADARGQGRPILLVGGERAGGLPHRPLLPAHRDRRRQHRHVAVPRRVVRPGAADHHLRGRRRGHRRWPTTRDLGLQAAVFTSSLTPRVPLHPRPAGRERRGQRLDRLLGAAPARSAAPRAPAAGWGRIGGKYTLLDMTDLRTAVIDIPTTVSTGCLPP